VVGVGGTIIDPDGKEENSNVWGLGKASNDLAEALALF